MKLTSISVKSPLKKECEDALIRNDRLQLFGVLDGVTPLHDYLDENGHNPAYLASRLVKQHLEHLAAIVSLEQALIEANERLLESMRRSGADLARLEERWSTCAAVVQIAEEDGKAIFRYAALGDSMITVRSSEGKWQSLTTDRVRGVGERALQQRNRLRAAGAQLPPETWFEEAPLERMKYNRTMANSEDGYGVLNGMPEAALYVQSGRLPLSGITHVALMTDGMFAPLEDADAAAERMLAAESLKTYTEWVENEERRQRLRPDDKTAILISF